MKQSLVVLLALALALPARSFADSGADQAEKAVVLMEQLANVVDANKANCDAMADKLGAWKDSNGAQLKQLKEAGKTLTAEQKKAFAAKYDDRMKAVGAKMMPGLQKCRSNAKVTATMKKLTAG
jgi:predicted negative regulator of RcsB-dependent stress response